MWALKTTKRKLTQNPVASTTHMGAPEAISGMAANCELPANTITPISRASNVLKPEFTIATPVIKPQAASPGAAASESSAPTRNSGCRK